MDKVVHFEIPADDLERAKKFYVDSFGWKLNDMPEMNYVLVYTGEVDEKFMLKETGAINGGMLKRNPMVQGPSITVNVANLEAAMQKVKASGGTIISEKLTVGDMGVMCYFKDTEGNVLSLWQNLK